MKCRADEVRVGDRITIAGTEHEIGRVDCGASRVQLIWSYEFGWCSLPKDAVVEVVRPRRKSAHSVILSFDRDSLTFTVKCHRTGADRECSVWYEAECQCTDPDCDCRNGDHHSCGWFDRGCSEWPLCSQLPADECWYEHAAKEVGYEAFQGTLSAEVPVTLNGYSWDEPIKIEGAR